MQKLGTLSLRAEGARLRWHVGLRSRCTDPPARGVAGCQGATARLPHPASGTHLLRMVAMRNRDAQPSGRPYAVPITAMAAKAALTASMARAMPVTPYDMFESLPCVPLTSTGHHRGRAGHEAGARACGLPVSSAHCRIAVVRHGTWHPTRHAIPCTGAGQGRYDSQPDKDSCLRTK